MYNVSISGQLSQYKRVGTSVVGSVGTEQVSYKFDPSWDGLTRIAYFRNTASASDESKVVKITLDDTNVTTIPWEVYTAEGDIQTGVLGMQGSSVVKPTIWITLSQATEGVPLIGENAQDFTPSLALQTIAAASNAEKSAKEAAESAKAAENKVQGVEDDVATVKQLTEEAKAAAKTATDTAAGIKDVSAQVEQVRQGVEAAQTAQRGAETAQAGAVEAKDEAQRIADSIQDVSSDAQKAAQAAKDADTARVAAESARDSASGHAESAGLSAQQAEQAASAAEESAKRAEAVVLDVDTAMSDTSVKPVQNKVIKKYVDDMLGGISTLVGGGL